MVIRADALRLPIPDSPRILGIDLAYMAGVIDSDGYIGIHRSTYAMRVRGDATQPIYQARIQVKQTEPEAIDLFQASFGGHRYQQKASSTRGKPLWTWGVHSAACKPILEALLPYLRIKPKQAANALVLCELATRPKRHEVPEVVEGEPMVTPLQVAELLPLKIDSIYQAVRQGTVPFVRQGGRQIFIPESFLATWEARSWHPKRAAEVSAQMEACYQRAKELNHVGR